MEWAIRHSDGALLDGTDAGEGNMRLPKAPLRQGETAQW
jgi:hypothetical protein